MNSTAREEGDLADEPTIGGKKKLLLGLYGWRIHLCGLEGATWTVAWSPVLHWHCRAEAADGGLPPAIPKSCYILRCHVKQNAFRCRLIFVLGFEGS